MKITVKRMTFCALLTAIALTIFMVEAQIPVPAPVPNFRLGLANIVTVYAMFALGPRDTFLILASRIILGSAFSSFANLPYSAAGGFCCYLIMLLLRRLLTQDQLWVCGAISSIFHNIGQMAMALFITRTPGLIIFLPYLMIPGVIAGVFTGLAAQLVLKRLGNQIRFDGDKK